MHSEAQVLTAVGAVIIVSTFAGCFLYDIFKLAIRSIVRGLVGENNEPSIPDSTDTNSSDIVVAANESNRETCR
jgi:hypothetical protein